MISTTDVSDFLFSHFWGVMVGYSSLVVTNIIYNYDRKLEIRVGNCCFLLHMVSFVSRASVKDSLYCNDRDNIRGVMVGCTSLVVTNIMYNHDRKLEIRVGNCCFLLQLVSFVSSASVKDPLYCNDHDNVRFRFFCWVIFRRVMVGCASLVVTNIIYNHNQKFHIKELTTITFRIQVRVLALLHICMQGLGRRNIVGWGVITICVQILMFK